MARKSSAKTRSDQKGSSKKAPAKKVATKKSKPAIAKKPSKKKKTISEKVVPIRKNLVATKKSSTKSSISSKKQTKSLNMSADKLSDREVVELYRRWGHLSATLDPLGFMAPVTHPHIDALDKSSILIKNLESVYTANIGAEFMQMSMPDRCEWVASRMEAEPEDFDERAVLKRILSVETFEKFLHTKYVGAKRFSLEGLAVVVPLIDSILDQAGESGVETVMIGMAHRGRLNVLHHIADTLAEYIVAKFEDVDPRSALGGDDVKYHLGASGVYVTSYGKKINVELAPNPSHLEAVNAPIMGRTRARQELNGDLEGRKTMCILLHGDAAFAGQGICAEALNYASIPGFSIGGTVHVVINNLIGFTATQPSLYSGRYCTDIAKRLEVPIFHVNGDSPRDVIKVGRLCADYRSEFLSDVVVDVIGYRRYGHNEADDPTLTSPVLYQKVKERPVLFKLYAQEIGVSEENIKQLEEGAMALFEESLKRGRAITKKPKLEKASSDWSQYVGGLYDESYEVPTALSHDILSGLARKLISSPADFNVHPKLQKMLAGRLDMVEGDKGVDWGMAEALAFASLLEEGYWVRLIGQDARRGTFNHRHAVLYDFQNGQAYSALQNLSANQGVFTVYDSMLSEAAAVGYEYGYTREHPKALVLWEGQFGDFVNGAQIIIDQFISAGEDKWGNLSGLVMLLPHGYEGAGPEHSSARLERFLQLCAEDNMQVAQPSTSAQYFHLLRRQQLRAWKKPLIVMTPKSMLRLPAASSSISEFTNSSFHNVLNEEVAERKFAERLILCSGKVVHELRAYRERNNISNTAIATLEQFYPIPEAEIRSAIKSYPNLKTIIWVQDEPANMGGLSFIFPSLNRLSGEIPVRSVKRSASASPATGSAKAHGMEQDALLRMAFTIS
jgi:2-oxoglutarate dehydrogenase E1 component